MATKRKKLIYVNPFTGERKELSTELVAFNKRLTEETIRQLRMKRPPNQLYR